MKSQKNMTVKFRQVLIEHIENKTFDERNTNVLKELVGPNVESTKNLQEVGDMFGITRERVRQIRNRAIDYKDRQKEKEEMRQMNEEQRMLFASAMHMQNLVLKLKKQENLENALKEKRIEQLLPIVIPHNRTPDMVYLRIEVAKILRNEFNFSLPQIGKLMHRDHTSIMNLLKK